MNKLVTMRYIPFALVLLVSLSAHTCNKKTADAAGGMEKMTSILDNKWIVQTLKGNAIEMPAGIEMPWLKLNKEGGQVEGFGGCNSLMGKFNLDGDRISFPGLGSTKKFCQETMPVENAMLSALKGTDQFKLDGDVLKLLSEGSEVATLKSE